MQAERTQNDAETTSRRLYSCSGLARRWDCDQSTVWRRFKRGQLPPSVHPDLAVWEHGVILQWERDRASFNGQLGVLADDFANRIEEILEAAEKRGCGFIHNEHRRITSLMAAYEQIVSAIRDILARYRNQGTESDDGNS
jgi:hypothetical protein